MSECYDNCTCSAHLQYHSNEYFHVYSVSRYNDTQSEVQMCVLL